jgi:hypothetical protein
MTRIYNNMSHSKVLQNLPKLGFLVRKETIWQPWFRTLCFLLRTFINLKIAEPGPKSRHQSLGLIQFLNKKENRIYMDSLIIKVRERAITTGREFISQGMEAAYVLHVKTPGCLKEVIRGPFLTSPLAPRG